MIKEKFTPEYIRGYLEALNDYAWWKDGEQFVGSTGSTLKYATLRFRRTVNTYFINNIPVARCPVCRDTVKLEGQTTDGKLVGSCKDTFLAEDY